MFYNLSLCCVLCSLLRAQNLVKFTQVCFSGVIVCLTAKFMNTYCLNWTISAMSHKKRDFCKVTRLASSVL